MDQNLNLDIRCISFTHYNALNELPLHCGKLSIWNPTSTYPETALYLLIEIGHQIIYQQQYFHWYVSILPGTIVRARATMYAHLDTEAADWVGLLPACVFETETRVSNGKLRLPSRAHGLVFNFGLGPRALRS